MSAVLFVEILITFSASFPFGFAVVFIVPFNICNSTKFHAKICGHLDFLKGKLTIIIGIKFFVIVRYCHYYTIS
jgi:hypothetical protein